MTDADAILAKLTAILREHVQYTGPIDAGMQLQSDLGLDSLQQLTFIVEVENAYQFCFEPGAEAELCTVHDVVAYIGAQQAQAIASGAPTQSAPT